MWGRIRQKIRCSTPLGHFWKWQLGDGPDCPWCKLCRKFPIVQKIIPYSYDGTDEYWGRIGGMDEDELKEAVREVMSWATRAAKGGPMPGPSMDAWMKLQRWLYPDRDWDEEDDDED